MPCVVNTLVATQTLRTGDRVRVDGDRGVVTRLDQTEVDQTRLDKTAGSAAT
ncbi:hypothetical protein [Dietzia sp. B44]|uniref:hypothetical protein n=1 Tax=Dietzia sp. B44 TaxID=1630633 RepID=UPI00240FF853|nr:hypothetical protein [Dietzia sp. B44]